MRREITVSGTVARYEWANPHVYLHLRDADTDAAEWEIEGGAVAMMRRHGWGPDSLAAGDRVSVTGNPGRDGDHRILRLLAVEKADGRLLENRPLQFAPAPDSGEVASGVSGTWVASGAGPAWRLFTNASALPLTAQGLAAAGGFRETVDSNGLDCVPFSIPMMMLLPDIKSISVDGETVRIRGEFDATTRTVRLDSRSHEGASPSVLGDSFGWWEGDELVIDTASYAPHAQGIATRVASSAQKHTIERLAPAADGRSLFYSVLVEDPEMLTEPVMAQMEWRYRPDLVYAATECSLSNARRFLSYTGTDRPE